MLRVAHPEYLGVVAAHLGKAAVTSQFRTNAIDQLLKQVREDEANNTADEFKSKKHQKKKMSGDKKHEKAAALVDKTEVQTNFSLILFYVLELLSASFYFRFFSLCYPIILQPLSAFLCCSIFGVQKIILPKLRFVP